MAAWLGHQDRFHRDSDLLVVTPSSVIMLGRVVEVATSKSGERLVVLSMRPFSESATPRDDSATKLLKKAGEDK